MGDIKKSLTDLQTRTENYLMVHGNIDYTKASMFCNMELVNGYVNALFGKENTEENIRLFCEENDSKYRNGANVFSDSFQTNSSYLINIHLIGEIPTNGISMTEDKNSLEFLMQIIHNVNFNIDELSSYSNNKESEQIIKIAAPTLYELTENFIDLERL